MRISIYKYIDSTTSATRVAARRVKTVDVDHFPNNQSRFAARNGGDFIEVEDQDDVLHWAGTLQADRQGHIRELLNAGIEE